MRLPSHGSFSRLYIFTSELCEKLKASVGEDCHGNINRYRRHKGAQPILDIKVTVLTFIPRRVSQRELSN